MKYVQIFTSNPNKIAEYRRFAEEFGVDFEVAANTATIPELQSEKDTDVVRSKMDYAKGLTHLPFMVEDTSFTVERYPNFPGTNAKFVNETVGIEGWKRLFEEGDAISAVTTIGLSYLGEEHFFRGRLDGVISFKYAGSVQPGAPINSIFFVPSENAFLADLMKDGRFDNHRKRAFKEMLAFVREREERERTATAESAAKWDRRAEKWDAESRDAASCMNYEDSYARFSSAVAKFLPVMNGRALDIGCGDGAMARQLAEKAELDVVGADTSEGMIRVAKRFERPNLRFVRASVEELAGEGKFDCIVSRGILISQMSFTAVVDYLRAVTDIAAPRSLFVFDFLQNAANGDFPTTHPLTSFRLEQLREIMRELGWVMVFVEGTEGNRVRTVAFHKCDGETAYFVTSNPLKVHELAQAVGPSRCTVQYLGLPFDEIKSDDLEKIVRDKLTKAYAAARKPVICTDGGIFIEALKGFPGENSRQAAEKLGAKGLLALLDGETNRRAVRRNCIGYFDGTEMRTRTAEIACEISTEPREGHKAYEMDKILVPISEANPGRLTYSQMPIEERVKFTELPQLVEFVRGI